MEEREYLHMYKEEEAHWWYAGMRSIVLSLLPPGSLPLAASVLDAGCGTGYNLGWLRRQYGAHTTGLDFSPHALDFCRRRGEYSLVRADAASLPLSDNAYDLVISFDVITHLKDEPARARALGEFFRVLKPGGRLMLRVPAYRFLRSGHDDAVMSYHRYGKRELGGATAAVGFRLQRLTGANTILFPGALAWRLLKKMGLAPEGSDVRATTRGRSGLNRALASVLRFEAAILRRYSLPFGLSMFLLAVKPAKKGNSS
jgi:SAM-dependent methyltransferase